MNTSPEHIGAVPTRADSPAVAQSTRERAQEVVTLFESAHFGGDKIFQRDALIDRIAAAVSDSPTTAVDAISREAAVQIAIDYADEREGRLRETASSVNRAAYLVEQAAACDIAAKLRSLPALQSTPTAIEDAAKEVAAACNGSDNDACLRVQCLWDMIENPTIANEAAFAKWLTETITRHMVGGGNDAE